MRCAVCRRPCRVGTPQRRDGLARRGDLAAYRYPGGHSAVTTPFVLVHADESCLGNDSTKPSRGGNAALIEAPAGDSVARWDFYRSEERRVGKEGRSRWSPYH